MNTQGVKSSYKNLAVTILMLENDFVRLVFRRKFELIDTTTASIIHFLHCSQEMPSSEAVKGEIFCVQVTELTNNGLLTDR